MKWYDSLIEDAKKIVRSGTQLVPFLFMRSSTGQLTLVPFDAIPEKDIMASIMKAFVQKYDPDEYLVIFESFIKEVDEDDRSDEALGKLVVDGTIRVSELPSSQDAIVILHGDRKGEKLGMITFQRKGKRVRFQPVKWMDEGEVKGRFAGLRGGK